MNGARLGSVVVGAWMISLSGSAALAVEPLKPGKDDTVAVRADLAWEDPIESITYYRGHFELSTPDWSVQAVEAAVFGSLSNPDRVLLNGEPARIWISQPEKSKIVEGQGSQIEYLLNADSVILSGGAELHDGDNIVKSESIHYDVKADSYSAGQAGRVKFSLSPKKH